MRETALPRFSFVVFISMRYAVFELGQRVVFALRLLVVLRDLFALRLLVSHPVVALHCYALGSELLGLGFYAGCDSVAVWVLG